MSRATKKTAKQRIMKKQKTKKIIFIIIIIIASLLAVLLVYNLFNSDNSLSSRSKQVAALKNYIFKNGELKSYSSVKDNFYVVFISICDAKSRAFVLSGTGETLESAWENADKKARDKVAETHLNIIWAKADIVNSAEEILTVDLNKETVKTYYKYFYRKGISLDENFNTAFLEAEVNGNKMLNYYSTDQISNKEVDYDSVILNIDNINNYLNKYYNRGNIKNIPEKITVFTTLGFFCGEDNIVHELYAGGLDYGRRIIDMVDAQIIKDVIKDAYKFLHSQIKSDGEFIYGYNPIFDNQLSSYNILRHAGSVWNLIVFYSEMNDASLIYNIDAAIDYIVNGCIVYKGDGNDEAYVIEAKANEIKVGGNALVILALTEYMEVFKTDKYYDLVCHLANGILALEDLNTGTFYHVLTYPGFKPKAEFRTVYYDGEATYALTKTYSLTKDEKYLNGAKMAVENFIANDYTQYRDHWVSYSLNEITKYVSDVRYYEFAMQNVANNLKRINNKKTMNPTCLELLMAGWETYSRIKENNIKLDYLNNFDTEYFAQTIYNRAKYMLSGYFYPEYAMYMKSPEKILKSFYIRDDNFRVRIDDVQHFIGGYYNYTKYYKNILPYLSESYLNESNKAGVKNYETNNEIENGEGGE